MHKCNGVKSMHRLTLRLTDRTGQDRTGQDRTGQDRTGQDRTGQDRTGQDRTGQNRQTVSNGSLFCGTLLRTDQRNLEPNAYAFGVRSHT